MPHFKHLLRHLSVHSRSGEVYRRRPVGDKLCLPQTIMELSVSRRIARSARLSLGRIDSEAPSAISPKVRRSSADFGGGDAARRAPDSLMRARRSTTNSSAPVRPETSTPNSLPFRIDCAVVHACSRSCDSAPAQLATEHKPKHRAAVMQVHINRCQPAHLCA